VDESLFSPGLFPLQATVSLGLEVLTPDDFKGSVDEAGKRAIAAYQLTKQNESARAEAYVSHNLEQSRVLVSF
jgi:hypothetical protein